jgi:2',3'-cyclic-nucleotide 3'-phosphodiesterase
MPKNRSPLNDALQATIDGLRPLFDDGHSFPPHVTITGGIRATSQAQIDGVLDAALAAAKSVPHINVVFSSLCYGSRFFKKVYFSVIPSPELVSLARISREEFVTAPRTMASQKNYSALSQQDRDNMALEASQQADQWVQHEYDPHLSLVYSDAYPVDEAQMRTIETRLEDLFGLDYNTKGIGWTNGRLAVVRCEGEVESWEVLGYRDI